MLDLRLENKVTTLGTLLRNLIWLVPDESWDSDEVLLVEIKKQKPTQFRERRKRKRNLIHLRRSLLLVSFQARWVIEKLHPKPFKR